MMKVSRSQRDLRGFDCHLRWEIPSGGGGLLSFSSWKGWVQDGSWSSWASNWSDEFVLWLENNGPELPHLWNTSYTNYTSWMSAISSNWETEKETTDSFSVAMPTNSNSVAASCNSAFYDLVELELWKLGFKVYRLICIKCITEF